MNPQGAPLLTVLTRAQCLVSRENPTARRVIATLLIYSLHIIKTIQYIHMCVRATVPRFIGGNVSKKVSNEQFAAKYVFLLGFLPFFEVSSR